MLPMFPLPMVVFPGEKVNLHIFEPRYKQLINECEAGKTTFGIPPFIDQKLMRVGTEIELVRVKKKYPKGEMDIETRAVGLFEILEFSNTAPGKLYGAAKIRPFVLEDRSSELNTASELLEKLEKLYDQLNARKELPDNPRKLFSFDFAHNVGLSLKQEYVLLTTLREQDRQQQLLDHLSRILPTVREMEHLKRKIQMNGHFKNFMPPQL